MPFESIFYNQQYVLLIDNVELRLFNLSTSKFFTIHLRDIEKAKASIYLMHFIENNTYFDSKKKSSAKKKKLGGSSKRGLNEEKRTPSKKDGHDFIDFAIEENFMDFRAKVRDRFVFDRNEFLLYISDANRFAVTYVDLSGATSIELNVSFEVIRMHRSPYTYETAELDAEEARVIVLVGREDVLVFRLFWIEGEKYFDSVLHLSDIEFMWESTVFIDPYKLLVRNENNEVIVVQLTPSLLGKVHSL